MAETLKNSNRIPAKLRFQTFRTIYALIMREMTTTHGRSPGGYIWAVVEPVAGIALMTLIFGLYLRSPPIGTSFGLFYATGLVPFSIYVDLQNKTAQTIRFSRPLLMYPKVTFLDAVFARFILNSITQLLVFYIVMTGVIFISGVSLQYDFGKIALSFGLAAALGLSIGSINSLLFAFFPIWERVWAVVTRPLLLVSCTFYLFEKLPESVQPFLWFNPLSHIVGLMRDGFYASYSAGYVSVAYVGLWCIIPLSFGVYFLRVYHKKILNEL